MPERMTLIAHPIVEDYGLVEASEEEHVEATVVLECSYTRDGLHSLCGIGVA